MNKTALALIVASSLALSNCANDPGNSSSEIQNTSSDVSSAIPNSKSSSKDYEFDNSSDWRWLYLANNTVAAYDKSTAGCVYDQDYGKACGASVMSSARGYKVEKAIILCDKGAVSVEGERLFFFPKNTFFTYVCNELSY